MISHIIVGQDGFLEINKNTLNMTEVLTRDKSKSYTLIWHSSWTLFYQHSRYTLKVYSGKQGLQIVHYFLILLQCLRGELKKVILGVVEHCTLSQLWTRRLQNLSLPSPSWDGQSVPAARTNISSVSDAAVRALSYFGANLNLCLAVMSYAEQFCT